MAASWAIVVPTVGRMSLRTLLDRLALERPAPEQLVLVHDRPQQRLEVPIPTPLRERTRVLTGPGRGPAAARNAGWRAVRSDWVVFLDDDVVPGPHWRRDLTADLDQPPDVAASQGRLHVPLPAHRSPGDWERQVARLAGAPWITADMAYRRAILAEVGGFDERFPRAFREDTDLAIRVTGRGYRIAGGRRVSTHPVRSASSWVSLRRQAGNMDDALLRRLHGRRWRALGQVPAGRRPQHALICAAGLAAVGARAAGWHRIAAVATAVWFAGTAEFAWRRIAPGPRTPAEVGQLTVTSALIPPLAVGYWLAGWLRHRGAPAWPINDYYGHRHHGD